MYGVGQARTEHILLGLLREGGAAARAPDGFDVTFEEVQARVASPTIFSRLLAGWLLFGVALGVGVLVGWAIWG